MISTIQCIVCGNEAIDDGLILSIEIAPDTVIEYECCDVCFESVDITELRNELNPVISGFLRNMRTIL